MTVVDALHCSLPMMEVYARSKRVDRFDLVLTVEIMDALYQCEHCGAKLTAHLEQPVHEVPS